MPSGDHEVAGMLKHLICLNGTAALLLTATSTCFPPLPPSLKVFGLTRGDDPW